jgi:hypothetical protein
MVSGKFHEMAESFLLGQDVEHWRAVYPLALVDIIVLVEQVTVDPDVGSVGEPVGVIGVAKPTALVAFRGAEPNNNRKLAAVPDLGPDGDSSVCLDIPSESSAGKFAGKKHGAGPRQVLHVAVPSVVEPLLCH